MALTGGGWSSVTTQASVFAGFLAKLAEERKVEATLEATGLFQEIDVFSSVSGGSWFISSLMYSDSFKKMVEKMAREYNKGKNWHAVKNIYQKEYCEPFMSIASKDDDIFAKDLSRLMQLFDHPGSAATTAVVGLTWDKSSWDGMVGAYLSSTTSKDITPATKVKDARPWAKGKTWLCNTSVVTPVRVKDYVDDESPAEPDDSDHEEETRRGVNQELSAKMEKRFAEEMKMKKPEEFERWTSALLAASSLANNRQLKYTLKGEDFNLPSYLPGRFAVTHGKAMSPVRFLPGDTLPPNAKAQWAAQGWFQKCRVRESPAIHFDNFTQDVGQLPLHKIVAASSAAAGGNIVSKLLRGSVAGLRNQLGPRMAVWAATNERDPFGASDTLLNPIFQQAFGRIDEQSVKNVADKGVLALVDGGYTDNTGIGHAVAVGAREVLAFATTECLLQLFRGDSHVEVDPITVPLTNIPVLPMTNFPMFEIDVAQYETVEKTLDKKDPDLADYRAGTITARQFAERKVNTFPRMKAKELGWHLSSGKLFVVTAANPWFGIMKGIPVKLVLILGGTAQKMNAGVWQNFENYSTAAGELVSQVNEWTPLTGPTEEGREGPGPYQLFAEFLT